MSQDKLIKLISVGDAKGVGKGHTTTHGRTKRSTLIRSFHSRNLTQSHRNTPFIKRKNKFKDEVGTSSFYFF